MKRFLLIFVFDMGSGPFTLLLMEGLMNHNFIIPRPKQKNKREMPEMKGKTPEIIDSINRCRGKLLEEKERFDASSA